MVAKNNSGFWGSFDNAYSLIDGKMPRLNAMRRVVNREGYRATKELFDTLLGSTSGTALATHSAIGHVSTTPNGGVDQPGMPRVITVTDINRSTTSTDITALKAIAANVSVAPVYPKDLSGNGGPALGTPTPTPPPPPPTPTSSSVASTSFRNGVNSIGYILDLQPGDSVATNIPGITVSDPATGAYSGTPSEANGTSYANGFVITRAGSPINIPITLTAQLSLATSPMIGFGDSMTAGSGASTTGNRWLNQFNVALGSPTLTNAGIGGTFTQNTPGTDTGLPKTDNGRDRFLPLFAGLARKQIAVLAYGYNDASVANNVNYLDFSATTFKNDYDQIISGVINLGTPKDRIWIKTPFWQSDARLLLRGYLRSDIEPYNTAVINLAKEFGLRFGDDYYVTTGRTDYIDPDGTHQNDAGHDSCDLTLQTAAFISVGNAPVPSWAVASTTSLDLSWTAPTPPSGTTVTDYTLEYGPSDESWTYPISSTEAGTTKTLSGLTTSTAYRARIRANFSDGSYSRWAFFPNIRIPSASGNTALLVEDGVVAADDTALTATTPETGTWTGTVYALSNLRIMSNRIVTASGGAASAARVTTQQAIGNGIRGRIVIDIKTNGSGLAAAVFLCVTNSPTFTGLMANYTNGVLQLRHYTNNVPTDIATQITLSNMLGAGAIAAGEHTLDFEAIPETINGTASILTMAYWDGEFVLGGSYETTNLPTLGNNHGIRMLGAIDGATGPTIKTVDIRAL
jgi:hypothetical protein